MHLPNSPGAVQWHLLTPGAVLPGLWPQAPLGTVRGGSAASGAGPGPVPPCVGLETGGPARHTRPSEEHGQQPAARAWSTPENTALPRLLLKDTQVVKGRFALKEHLH